MRSCSLTPVLQKSCKLSIKWQSTLPQLMECQNVCFNLCILKIKKTLSRSVATCQAIKTTTTSWENKKQYVSSYILMRHKHIYCICVCSDVLTHIHVLGWCKLRVYFGLLIPELRCTWQLFSNLEIFLPISLLMKGYYIQYNYWSNPSFI